MKSLVASSILILAAACGSVSASPVTGEKLSGDSIAVTRIAGYVCSRDDRGWHYMRGERRMTCRPARPSGKEWGWRCEGKRCGWWHRGEKRWND